MGTSNTAQDAQAFLNHQLESDSTIPEVAARIWFGCVTNKEPESLMTQKIFQESELPNQKMNELKQRSSAGDGAATREGLSIVIGTLKQGVQTFQSTQGNS